MGGRNMFVTVKNDGKDKGFDNSKEDGGNLWKRLMEIFVCLISGLLLFAGCFALLAAYLSEPGKIRQGCKVLPGVFNIPLKN
jgi:hypothetical protein